MSIEPLKSEVLDRELCAGCGICALVCPHQKISFDAETVTPLLNFDFDICGECNDCVDVCPGADTGTDQSEMRLFGRIRNNQERWLGIYQSYFGMTATDAQIYEKSASGGATTALLLATAEQLDVKWFLSMGRNAAAGWRAAPSLSGKPDIVINNAQSTYQLAPYLQALRPVYDDHREDNVGVVGLACHMQAIRKLQAQDTAIGRWAREKVVFLIETACSSNTLPSGTATILRDEAGCNPDEIGDVRFREGPYPGNFQATKHSSEKLDVPFWKILSHLKANKSFRCLSCGDWMSGLADISVCDGDPNIFDTSVNGAEIQKHGRVLVRTETGRTIVEHAINTGQVESWPIDLLGFNLGLERKRSRRLHYEGTERPLSKGSSAKDSTPQEELVSDDDLINPERYK